MARVCHRVDGFSLGAHRSQSTVSMTPANHRTSSLQVFDRDRNGFISAVELKETMRELGVHITDEDAACMIREADLDGDGKINYQGTCHRCSIIARSTCRCCSIIARSTCHRCSVIARSTCRRCSIIARSTCRCSVGAQGSVVTHIHPRIPWETCAHAQTVARFKRQPLRLFANQQMWSQLVDFHTNASSVQYRLERIGAVGGLTQSCA